MEAPRTVAALRLWHEALAANIRREGRDLTVRQMAILLAVYLNPRPPHTVRGLAQALGLSKPVITRALDRMGRMGLVKRVRDKGDRRNVLVYRTVAGSRYLTDLADDILAAFGRIEE